MLRKALFSLSAAALLVGATVSAAPQNPIVFVTQVPQPEYFATIGATFANHLPTVESAPRGGDLYIRYSDGTLKNITKTAGFGNDGLQGANSIAVRDPAVHWDGAKVLFSMVIGSPGQFGSQPYRWQLYEATNLGKNQTPIISKVVNQPTLYNNIMPTYGSDDSIIFVSDRPYNGMTHLFPQLDEYEATETNSGIWKISAATGGLSLLDVSPSGNYTPIVDSFGRIVFTRWDHLQQDQLADTSSYGAFNYSSEAANATSLNSRSESFPEARGAARRTSSTINLHTMDFFSPWQMQQDGTGVETLNHIGRHELASYLTKSFLNDSSLVDFDSRFKLSLNPTPIQHLFQIREDPRIPGRYYATNASEFRTQSCGQIVRFDSPQGMSADEVIITSVTHPDTANSLSGSAATDSGLYRNPLPLSNGEVVAVHTPETRDDQNTGTRAAPASRYSLRLKLLTASGSYFTAGEPLTGGIQKSVNYWDPDVRVSYSGELWELSPVELVARARPSAPTSALPSLEQSIFAEEGFDFNEFTRLLRGNGLALIITRDVTTRDRNDKLQPFNLRVAGTNKKTVGNSGKIYDVAAMQIFQGDQVRAYTNFEKGRRFIPQPLDMGQLPDTMARGGVAGSVALGSDGSMAAIVPARKPLTWQLTDPNGAAVVRERVWVTLAPGEVRMCTSCHGINTRDQAGNTPPTNAPEALRTLLRIWKSKGVSSQLPGAPTDDLDSGTIPGSTLAPKFSVVIRGKAGKRKKLYARKLFAKSRGVLLVRGKNISAAYKNVTVRFKVNSKRCRSATEMFQTAGDGSLPLQGTLPAVQGEHPVVAELMYNNKVVAKAPARVIGANARTTLSTKARRGVTAKLCRALAGWN